MESAHDVDELMHLALHATQNSSPEKAITHLKRLLDVAPDHANAIYLLGALHAEIGMHDRAAEEMGRALELDPTLATARFQLGLLHITSGRVAEAEEVWKSLEEIGADHALFLFKQGMLHLVRDEFTECVEALRAGIAANDFDENLNNDMRRVLGDAERALDGRAGAGTNGSKPNGESALLSAYHRSDDNA
jgi:tetratricopeptide (TPR) repeat protein